MSSLIETLRSAVDDIPPSHLPANAVDAVGLVGSLIAYTEHGAEKFLDAIEHGTIADLYKNFETADNAVAAEAAGLTKPESDTPAPTLEELQTQLATLQAQLAAAQGVAQQTTVGEGEASA